MSFRYELKIPEERVAVLIGKKGETKRFLEKELQIKIKVDSEESDVIVTGDDGLKLFTGKEVVQAIARGFSPENAMKLAKLDYAFELIRIDEYARNKHDVERLRGRLIGREGRSRELIEEFTGCDVCVYGKTVGIIGSAETNAIARRAIEMLLGGSMHATVYKYLERQQRMLKMQPNEEEIVQRDTKEKEE